MLKRRVLLPGLATLPFVIALPAQAQATPVPQAPQPSRAEPREAAGMAACRVSLGRRVNQGSQVDRANPEMRAGQGEQEERAAEAVMEEPVAWETVEVMAAEVAMEAALDRSAD